jgi:hypothetical protein
MNPVYKLLGLGLLTVLLTGRADAKAPADLDTTVTDVDRERGPAQDPNRAANLSKEFDVPVEKVTALRSDKKGWGAITAELALAQQLAAREPKTYPTTSDALVKIEAMRNDHMGYGKIANELGFKLGPIVSAVHRQDVHARTNRVEPRPDSKAGERPARLDRPEHPDHPERIERPDHPDPAHPVRPDNPAHSY